MPYSNFSPFGLAGSAGGVGSMVGGRRQGGYDMGAPAQGPRGWFGGTYAPDPGDFVGAAREQAQMGAGAINQQTAQNRPDQQNAFGAAVTWEMGPDGRPVQRQSFGGPLGNAANNLMGQIGNMTPFSFSGEQARNQAIDAAYGQSTSRLDPMWKQREEQQRTQLLNQGLAEGSEAYQNAMGSLGQQRNDAYQGALNSAIGQGTQAGNALFQQALQQRALPMQELSGLGGFLGQQGFNTAGAATPPQLLQAMGLQDAAQFRNWGANNKAEGDFWSGLGNFGLGVVDTVGGLFGLGGKGGGNAAMAARYQDVAPPVMY